MQDSRETYTVDEVAKRLGIGRGQAYEAARAGQIPTLRIGKRILVLSEPFERMLKGMPPESVTVEIT